MGVLDFEANASFWENGSGKLFIATDYDGTTFDDWDGTNGASQVATIENNFTFADVGYFENFAWKLKAGEEKVIMTDYENVSEISRKSEKVAGFTVDIQEILEMSNLALILGVEVDATSPGHDVITMKRKFRTLPYHLFKFVTAPRNGLSQTYYFVKTAQIGDIETPVINLNRNDFVGVSLEFEVASSGNFFIDKDTATPEAEVQSLAVSATAGTYTITYKGATTSAIAFNATPATVTAAMEALVTVWVGDVVVTGGVGNVGGTNPYIFTWDISLGNVPTPTTNPAALTGGTASAVFTVTNEWV